MASEISHRRSKTIFFPPSSFIRYYNQVLGLSPWLVSMALAIALVVDAVTDPVVGYVSDHTRTKWGRRHPYIYISVIPSSAFYFFLIMADFGESQTALFVQLLLLITGLRVSWTFFQCLAKRSARNCLRTTASGQR